jgi:hypothetical protein
MHNYNTYLKHIEKAEGHSHEDQRYDATSNRPYLGMFVKHLY